MPLGPGRDFGTYAGAFVELFQSDPIDLGYVLGRTPVAPLVTGGLLAPFDGALAEPGMSLLYAGSILAWFLAARRFGGAAALLTVVVLLAYPELRDSLPRDRVGLRLRDGLRGLVAARSARRRSTDDRRIRRARRRRGGADSRPATEPGARRPRAARVRARRDVAVSARVGGCVRRALGCASSGCGPCTTASASATTRYRAPETRTGRSTASTCSTSSFARTTARPRRRWRTRCAQTSSRTSRTARTGSRSTSSSRIRRRACSKISARSRTDAGAGTRISGSFGTSPSRRSVPIRARMHGEWRGRRESC